MPVEYFQPNTNVNMLDELYKGQTQRLDVDKRERDAAYEGEDRQNAQQKRIAQLLAREVSALDTEEKWNQFGPGVAEKYKIPFAGWEGGTTRQRVLDMGAEMDPQLLSIKDKSADKSSSLFGNSFEGRAREILATQAQSPGTYPQEVIDQAVAYLQRPRFAPQGAYPVVASVPGVSPQQAPVSTTPLAPPSGGQRVGSSVVGSPLEKQLPAKQATDNAKLSADSTHLSEITLGFEDDFSGPSKLMNSEIGQSLKKDYPGISGLIEKNTNIEMPSEKSGMWWESYAGWRNKTRHELFGSALTATEKAAFAEQDINPNMDPKRIKANLARQRALAMNILREVQSGQRAAGYSATPGAQPGAELETAQPNAPPTDEDQWEYN